jgi:nucleoside-diphosphate-sugar epimerase
LTRKARGEAVLVTGYPSFRAKKMVEHLASAEPDATLFLVVRPKFGKEAELALEQMPRSERDRIVMIEGDAAAMDLGLSGKEYRDLAARVERIHHLAQVTYPGADRKMAESVNIGAMREIVELGRVCKNLRSIIVHSSAIVSGSRTGLVLEAELSAGQSFRTPVEETLARAERFARAHMGELPIIVVRPTQIMGDSRSGEVDRFDGPYLLILLIVSSPQDLPVPLPTRGDAPMNLVPIDYAVRAAHFIGRRQEAIGKTFHIADPRPLTVRRVFELVAAAGGKRLPGGFIPTRLTRALLNTPGVSLVSKSPRAFLELLTTPVRYDTKHTEQILSGSGIVCPPFESYVDALVAYVKRRVQARRVQSSGEDEGEVEDALL